MNTRRSTFFVLILSPALFTFADTVRLSDLTGNSGMFGDFDGDGDVDALDYNAAQICASFSGPNIIVPTACLVFDSNEDGDVDLEDLAAFLEVYTGSLGGVVVEAGQLFPVFGGIGIYYSGEPGAAGNNALHGVAAQAGYTQDDLWYSWSVDSQPLGSGDVVMANAASPSTAYMILSDALPGRYVFRLVVTNLITLEAGADTSFLDIVACVCEPGQECIDGECVVTNPCEGIACDDGDACNGFETCDAETGDCLDGTPVECQAGESCLDGQCVPIDPCEGVTCDDGDACNGFETCDAETGDCVDGTPVECQVGESCLDGECVAVDPCEGIICADCEACVDGYCVRLEGDAAAGETYYAAEGCAVCHGADGSGPPSLIGSDCSTIFDKLSGNVSHVGGTRVVTDQDAADLEAWLTALVDCIDDSDCDDGFSCTTNTCNTATGDCVLTTSDALCHDVMFCTGDNAGDVCDPTDADAGADGCVRDGNPCSGTAPICDENAGSCNACNYDGECDDGFFCTNDTCEGDGSCTNATVNANCADPVFCDGEDICDPTDDDADENGCVPPGTPCVGGTPVCDEATETCRACQSNADCDDGLSCTDDTCDGLSGTCTSTPDNANCTDAEFCNGVDVCDPTDPDADAAGCFGPGNSCGGGTPVCDENTDTCSACTSNADCDDGVDCTDDTCDGGSGACTNADNCPIGEGCLDGADPTICD